MCKRVLLISIVVLVSAFLLGCGGGTPADSKTASKGEAKKATKDNADKQTTGDTAKKPQVTESMPTDQIGEIRVVIETAKGNIRLRLFADKTPLTCANFVNLVRRGFYDGLKFHRVIEDFMIQGGCPLGNGRGNPGYRFEDEIVPELRHSKAGILSMANAGPNTNGSQFFITHKATPHLDGKHAVFGEVIDESDQSVVNSIAKDDKIERIIVEGDIAALMNKNKNRLAQWNKVLDKKFPNLRPAE